jgi:hypothetical protein
MRAYPIPVRFPSLFYFELKYNFTNNTYSIYIISCLSLSYRKPDTQWLKNTECDYFSVGHQVWDSRPGLL